MTETRRTDDGIMLQVLDGINTLNGKVGELSGTLTQALDRFDQHIQDDAELEKTFTTKLTEHGETIARSKGWIAGAVALGGGSAITHVLKALGIMHSGQ